MDLIEILTQSYQDPIIYSLLFFIYTILAAVILPIPVEIGLFNPNVHPLILISILAIGKGVGAGIVFIIGAKIRSLLKRMNSSSILTKKILYYCEKFVIKYGNIGLFIVMSIPLMIDSVSLYLFSLLNPKEESGKYVLAQRRFIMINIGAGLVRGSIIMIVFWLFQVRLVS
jgi:membrane protein YqaA with SNARE-associated domain